MRGALMMVLGGSTLALLGSLGSCTSDEAADSEKPPGTSGAAGASSGQGGAAGDGVAGGESCSLLQHAGEGVCVDGIIDHCCTQYDACEGVCLEEFQCVQISPTMPTGPPNRSRAELDAALQDCGADGGAPSPEVTALFDCLVAHDATLASCLGGYVPEGMAGSAGSPSA